MLPAYLFEVSETTTSIIEETESEVTKMEKSESPAKKKFSAVAKRVMMVKQVHAAVTTIVDGEDSQEIWPATAAWFLGPKAENLELLKTLVTKAIDEHAEFRKYKYFPLDPEYVTKKLETEPAFQEATEDLRDNLDILCQRLKNSVPFSNFRSQVSMIFYYLLLLFKLYIFFLRATCYGTPL